MWGAYDYLTENRSVAEAGQPGAEIRRVPGAGHVDAFDAEPDEYVEWVVAYLEERFR